MTTTNQQELLRYQYQQKYQQQIEDTEIVDLILQLYQLEDDIIEEINNNNCIIISVHDIADRVHSIALKLNKWNVNRIRRSIKK